MVADSTHPNTVTDNTHHAATAGGDAATNLSQQATKPGDHGALTTVRGGATASGLPEVNLTGAPATPAAQPTEKPPAEKPSAEKPPAEKPPAEKPPAEKPPAENPTAEKPPAEKPPTLNQKTLETTARELHDAIMQTKWFGLRDDPDADKINRILGPLGEADRKALEKTYHDIYDINGPAGTLRHDLKDKLGEYDFRHCESTLNTKDGVTNDAGALMTALTHAKDDSTRGSAEVRAVLQNLNSEQLAKLDADFKAQFGKSYLDAIKESSDLDDATQKALPYLEKGVDKRTADDLVNLAKIGIENGDRRVFAEAVRGDSPEAKAARERILADNNLKNELANNFPSDAALNAWDSSSMPFEQKVDPIALDYLKDGRISLSTIASANTGMWFLDNKSNIELATQNATPTERQDFAKGQALALGGKAPANADEQRELDFYNKIHSAFKDGGNDRETSIWEDQLIHGRETVISQMAKTHSEGHVWGLFGAGHDANELMGKVDNLSKDDWNLLRGPDGDKFRTEIGASLDSYDPQDKARIMDLLNKKAGAATYEDACKIHRDFSQTAEDSKGSVFLGMGTSYDGKTLINNIMNMSADDAAKYKSNPDFRKNIDDLIKDNFDDTQKALAHHLLAEVAQTGQPPKADAVDKVLNDSVQGANASQVLADAEKALRLAMNKPDDQLTDEQRQFKQSIQSAVLGAIMQPGMPPEAMSDDLVSRYTKSLFETGHIPADLKTDLGYSKDQVLMSAAAAPPAERDRAMQNLNDDEKAIVNGIRQNADGKPDLADRIRMMATGAGGNPEDFKDELTKLSFQDRQNLKDEYSKKYGHDIDNDFLSKVNSQEKSSYENLLRPATTDGRQTYYDNYHRMLESESGFSPDGSQMTLERANDMYQQGLEEYQKVYKTLPREKQEALDKYFNQALEQYKDSKEKLAEIVVDATITATALAAAPFTGGASLGVLIATSAAAGAAFRVTAMKAIEGNDFDGSAKNLCKQLIIGGSSAALNFIGAEAFAGAGQLARGVSEQAIAGIAATGGRDILTQGGREILQAGLPKLVANGGKNVAESELAELVAKAAPAASAGERQAMVRGLQDTIAKTYEAEQARITEQVAQRTAQQTLRNLGKEVAANGAIAAGGNVASEILVAPFNEGGVDWQALANGGLQGAAIGAILPVALKGLVHAAGACGEIVTNLTKRADGLYIDPKNITEPVTLRNSSTGEVRTFQPGQGEALKLTNDLQVQSGGRPVAANDKLRDASGKPVANDGSGSGHPPRPEDNPARPADTPAGAGDGPARTGDGPESTAQRPSAQAVSQSNEFSTNHEVKEPIEDGFTYASANRQFDNLGRPTTGSDPSFVVDKKELAPVIADAKARFANLPPEERAVALSKYVHEKFNPPGMSQQDINKWYLNYLEAHPGQKITLGQLLKEGKGVCTQEAVLLKVLGDELGLKPTLIRGNGLNGGDDINHAWTTFDFGDGPRVFDPRQNINNVPADQVATHKPGSDIVAGQGASEGGPRSQEHFNYNGSDGWKIDGTNADGTVNISRPGVESVKPGADLNTFQTLNADQLAKDGGLKVGQRYHMRRADGSIDDSFKLDGIESDGSLRLSSDSAVHEANVRPELLRGGNPEMATSTEELKAYMAKKDTSFEDFYLHATDGDPKNPELKALVKERLEAEINEKQDLLKDASMLPELRQLAKHYGLGDDYSNLLTKRLTDDLRKDPNLLSDSTKLENVKKILGDLRTPETSRGPKVETKSIDSGLEKQLLQNVNNALTKAEQTGASVKGLSELAAATGSQRIKNAVRFYEVTDTVFDGTLDCPFESQAKLDRTFETIASIEKDLQRVSAPIHKSKFDDIINAYGYKIASKGEQHNRAIIDMTTGEEMRDWRPGQPRNAQNQPNFPMDISLTHKTGAPKDYVKPAYQRNVLNNLIAMYASGVR
jgi:cation transport regulator ChaB